NARHGRNDGACMAYGSACRYLGICSGYDSPESANWRVKANCHSELPEIDGDGRDVLTYSRLRCFKTCRRKHYYRYELGIEKIDEEEREALLFGHVWHEGLREWWNFLKEKSDGSDISSPATEAGKRVDASTV
ncbi:MAG TPA: PD-(D/E)XK nuclease family protein, partial [Planctomycetota bacterium]|nr:PD-(D/E)XK nuclease family protein [Planctomycetota bacterium]